MIKSGMALPGLRSLVRKIGCQKERIKRPASVSGPVEVKSISMALILWSRSLRAPGTDESGSVPEVRAARHQARAVARCARSGVALHDSAYAGPNHGEYRAIVHGQRREIRSHHLAELPQYSALLGFAHGYIELIDEAVQVRVRIVECIRAQPAILRSSLQTTIELGKDLVPGGARIGPHAG